LQVRKKGKEKTARKKERKKSELRKNIFGKIFFFRPFFLTHHFFKNPQNQDCYARYLIKPNIPHQSRKCAF
jgi:hypothetical protein